MVRFEIIPCVTKLTSLPGDIIYSKGQTIDDLEAAWQAQRANPDFQAFQTAMIGRSTCQ
jgi:Zn-dependent M32 family carboxypeptidase